MWRVKEIYNSFRNDKLSVCVYIGENKINYNFTVGDSPIIFGRGKSCKVKIDSNFLSKKHTTVEFNKYSKIWEIRDGYDQNWSLNGTWLWLNTKYEINETIYLKIGTNIIKIHFL